VRWAEVGRIINVSERIKLVETRSDVIEDELQRRETDEIEKVVKSRR
jgi:hypothetical protein